MIANFFLFKWGFATAEVYMNTWYTSLCKVCQVEFQAIHFESGTITLQYERRVNTLLLFFTLFPYFCYHSKELRIKLIIMVWWQQPDTVTYSDVAVLFVHIVLFFIQ